MIERYSNDGTNIIEVEVSDVCPITGRKFFMIVEHPDLGDVPTYGGPYDSYTIPVKIENADGYHCERFDHDEGAWIDGGETVIIE